MFGQSSYSCVFDLTPYDYFLFPKKQELKGSDDQLMADIKQDQQFKYLGVVVMKDGLSRMEIINKVAEECKLSLKFR